MRPEEDHYEDDHGEDYDDLEDFMEDDEDLFEDQEGLKLLKERLRIPEPWFLVKVFNFHGRTLVQMDEWLRCHARGEYKRMGWSTGCSTKVGVAFEDPTDAVYFKLSWGS